MKKKVTMRIILRILAFVEVTLAVNTSVTVRA